MEALFQESLTNRDISEIRIGIEEIKRREGDISNYLYPIVIGLIVQKSQ